MSARAATAIGFVFGSAGRLGSRAALLCVVCVAVLVASCATVPERPQPLPEAAPADFPAASYAAARARGHEVYAIDPSRSLVTVVVRRGGTLAKLGHDHVVASRDLRGFVDASSGRADLYARLDLLTVDEPALRQDAHLDTQPSSADVAGTRHNMLERVLHVERHPFVEVAVRGASVAIALNGVTRTVPVQMAIRRHGDDLEATGSLAIDQTDFALVPMSLFGGAVTVEDRLELAFVIRARRAIAPVAGSSHRGPG